jgi:hypothetical protein
MRIRTLALALALAAGGSLGVAQAAAPKHSAKAAKFKSTKVNTRNQKKFSSSHKIVKRNAVKAPAKHTARKTTVRKVVKPKNHA